MGFLLKDTSRLYVRRFEQRAAPLGLTLPQSKVLVYLADNEGISQAQLAELIDLEAMTLVRSLDFLEAEGWLERRNDPTDRRVRCLYLRGPGKARVMDIWSCIELTYREAFSGISRKHAELMIELLDKVRMNISSLEPIEQSTGGAYSHSSRDDSNVARVRRPRAASRS